MPRAGILYGGGHISSFMAGTAGFRTELPPDWELIGFEDGYAGLNSGRYRPITGDLIEPQKAGTFLGSTRDKADVEKALETRKRLQLDALLVMGGDDHLGEAQKLYEAGLPVVGWPKTMDNDLSVTQFTLGYPTAVDVASRRLRNAHTGAVTNKRIYFVPMFGRDTDWVAAAAGLWGGCDFVVLGEKTEYPFGMIMDKVIGAYDANGTRYGRPFAVVAVAEGAHIKGVESHLRPGDIDKHGHMKIEPMKLALVIKDEWKKSAPAAYRDVVAIDAITYEMRDCPPSPLDHEYAREAGAECARMVKEGDFGKSAVFKGEGHGYRTERAPLSEVSKQRFMRPEGWAHYDDMTVNLALGGLYEPLFGKPPEKKDLVFRALR